MGRDSRPNCSLQQSRVPRPRNKFMIFRSDLVFSLKQSSKHKSLNQALASKDAGVLWKSLPLDDQRIYEEAANDEKKEHSLKHPDYKFEPKKGRKQPRESRLDRRGYGGDGSVTSAPEGDLITSPPAIPYDGTPGLHNILEGHQPSAVISPPADDVMGRSEVPDRSANGWNDAAHYPRTNAPPISTPST